MAITQPAPAPAPRDRIVVHLVWEAAVALLVIGLFVLVIVQAGTPGRAMNVVVGSAVVLLPMAMAFALSLRAAAPNLAVAAIGSLGGVILAQTATDGGSAIVGIVLAVGAGLVVGIVLGLVVVVLHVPSWAASLVVALGLQTAALALLEGRTIPFQGSVGQTGLTLGLVVLAVLSVAGGVLFAFPGPRNWFGSARADRDPARRPTIQGAAAVFVALTASSTLAAIGGVIATYRIRAATPVGGFDIAFVLVAVILGGASLYGRRAGILGTLLGTLAVVLVQIAASLLDAEAPFRLGGIVLLGVLGLAATRLVETLGGSAPEPIEGPSTSSGQRWAPPAYAPAGPPRTP